MHSQQHTQQWSEEWKGLLSHAGSYAGANSDDLLQILLHAEVQNACRILAKTLIHLHCQLCSDYVPVTTQQSIGSHCKADAHSTEGLVWEERLSCCFAASPGKVLFWIPGT